MYDKKEHKGTCGVWSSDETIAPKGFRKIPVNCKCVKNLRLENFYD